VYTHDDQDSEGDEEEELYGRRFGSGSKRAGREGAWIDLLRLCSCDELCFVMRRNMTWT
jgi:hypothetical protein